jgi:TRAP transporter TAXI family solute receptor
MFPLRIVSAALCACILLAAAPLHAQQQRSITIGVADGDMAGQTLGTAICALINSGSPEHGMLCSTPTRAGAAENLQALETEQQTIAIVLSDVHASAYEGSDRFEGKAFKDLRSLFSAQARAFTLVAGKSSGIAALDDLKNRHVNIGAPDTAQRLLMNAVLRAKGWTTAEFASVLELNAKDQLTALCDGKADAAVFAAAPPDPLVKEALATCGAEIVPAIGEDIVRLVDDSMYLTEAVIPAAGDRPGDKDITT